MESVHSEYISLMEIVRYNGAYYKITPKAYEPERQTAQVAWAQIREPTIVTSEHYKRFFEKQRKEARILYPSFRKDDN